MGRFSIARLMIVVAAAAAQLALFRAASDRGRVWLAAMLPVVDLLLLGLWRARVPARRPFWAGFEGVGWSAVLLLLAASAFLEPQFLFGPILWLSEAGWISEDSPLELAKAYGLVALIYSTPPLLAAWFAGWFSARYRVVIEPRARDPGVSPAGPSPGRLGALP